VCIHACHAPEGKRGVRQGHRLALALQEYRRSAGEYPERIERIAPEVMPLVPADPFTDKPFRYQRLDGRYRLYSLGPDGKDDGGRPVRAVRAVMLGGGDLVARDLVRSLPQR
jgi:hypothetical protein